MSHPAFRIPLTVFGILSAAFGTLAFVTSGHSVWMAVIVLAASNLSFGLLLPWMLRKRANFILTFACMVVLGVAASLAGKGGGFIVIGSMYVCSPMIYRVAEQIGRENRISGEQ